MLKIVILENKHIVTNSLIEFLETKYKVILVKNENELLDSITKNNIDLILLNTKVSELCIKIKSDTTTQNIPVVFILDEINENSISQVYEIGANGYITKPFVHKEILSKFAVYVSIKKNKKKLQHTIDTKTALINELLDVGVSLTSQTNFNLLMEKIVIGTKQFSKADACTIYLLSKCKKTLEFSIVQTDQLDIKMGGTGEKISWPPLQLYKEDGTPNDSMVAVKCALENKLFNFDDVYDVDEFNFEGTKIFDDATFYRTKSMIVVPMLNTEREVIGVIQLINKLDKNGEVISFNDSDEILLSSMSSLGGVSVHNHKLVENLQELLDSLEIKVEERTKDLVKAKKEVEVIHAHTRESIEYAALIQSAVLPDNNLMRNYFKDQFTIWHPKDTVGGDIYFFEALRHDDECLLFFIDCTGHGVPGAFVTMLVKAVEQQIIAEIMSDKEMEISPAWIMAYFNRELKKLLKQDDSSSISNAGWDGGIIYYNKKEQILKFAGAETPLFYMTKDGEFNTVKGNRYSVGYKKCAIDYEYKETILEVEEGMKFWCTTDGYLDQNGGEKDFPFGKKRFGNIIKEYHQETMADQQEMFLYEMAEYEEMIANNDRNDDMTVIAFEIGK